MNPTIPPFPDADSGPFWDATRRHELQVQRCRVRDRLLFPARPACDLCGHGELDWVTMSGRGTVLSWVVTHQVFNKLFMASVPFTTLLVQLEEAPNLLMYGNWARSGWCDSAPGGAVDSGRLSRSRVWPWKRSSRITMRGSRSCSGRRVRQTSAEEQETGVDANLLTGDVSGTHRRPGTPTRCETSIGSMEGMGMACRLLYRAAIR